MHAERLLYSICVPSLVLIAQAVFLLERGQTDATERPTHAGGCIVGVGNMHIHNNEILNRQSTHILLYEKYIFHIPITLLRPRNHDLSKCNILLGFFLYFTDG